MLVGSLARAGSVQPQLPTVYRTTTPWERMRGLLGRTPLAQNEGLLIDPCGSIHTLFMSYSIDVVYLSNDMLVTKIVPAIRSWRFSMGFGAAMTLELRAGMAAKLQLERGTELVWASRGKL